MGVRLRKEKEEAIDEAKYQRLHAMSLEEQIKYNKEQISDQQAQI